MARQYTTEDIEELLRKKYPTPQYAFWTQIPNGTSTNKSRTCDAMAIGCWKTVKIELTGFEIKVSRSDWLKEIQDVHKAEAFSVYCNRWYIVAPVGIVKLEELPPSWGLMCPTSAGNLRVKSVAELNENPRSVPLTMLAGMMRSAVNSNRSLKDQERALREAHSQGKELGRSIAVESVQRQRTIHERCYEDLQRTVREFEEKSGLKLQSYNAGQIADAVKLLGRIGEMDTARLKHRCQKVLESIEELDLLASDPVKALSVPQNGSGSDIS